MTPTPLKEINIFIGSPHDVKDERDKARRVIADLQRQYDHQVKLVPVLWEDMLLCATSTFQDAIERVLAKKDRIDIAVFIFWSWFGSPPDGAIKKANDEDYLSGTEREFDVMTEAYGQSGGKSPLILVYTRKDEEGFSKKLDTTKKSDADIRMHLRQRELLADFIHDRLQPQDGANKGAYYEYKKPADFAQTLRGHLREYIEDILGLTSVAALWPEAPYRSLEVFDIRHAPIFRGRDKETCDLLQQLDDQQENNCAFVCIIGASGSGKSSLARGGVAATLLQYPYDETVKEWRVAVMLPSLASGNLPAALAKGIAEVLPELGEAPGGFELFTRTLEDGNRQASSILLDNAFRAVADKLQGPVRLLLVLDQMEELWTVKEITAEKRDHFLLVIETLARCSHISVLATLRIDFYPQAQSSETFQRMKKGRGHYDLPKPGEISLREIIERPARSAGLVFERDKTTDRSLLEQILQDATGDADGLPLLQYALAELYVKRDQKKAMLTFAAYAAMKGDAKNGVEGALVQRAAQIFKDLTKDSQNLTEEDAKATFNKLLPLLVAVDEEGQVVRRRKPLSELTRTPETRLITERLIAARFITTDQEGGTPIATLAHEALLRCWDQIVTWIKANEALLRMSSELEQNQHKWKILPKGPPLEEGRHLLLKAPELLDEEIKSYVRCSVEAYLKDAISTGQDLLVCSDDIEGGHPAEWRNVVAEAFHSDDAAARRNVASIMAHRSSPDFQDDLIRLVMHDQNESVRQSAASALVLQGHTASYDQIRGTSAAGAKPATLTPKARSALAELKAFTDRQSKRLPFADWFEQQTWSIRWQVIPSSHWLRLSTSVPTFLFVLIPSMTFAAAGAAGVKWFTSHFNYACVQATASLGTGFFHGAIAGIILGGGVVFGLTLYRVVFGREYDKVSFFRPMPALAYGVVFGALMGVFTVLMISQIYHPGALYAMGWISQRTRPELLPLMRDLFFANRCGLGFPLSSIGFGLGFALTTNGLRASEQWSEFINAQSAISSAAQIYKVVKGVVKVTLPFAFPIPLFVIIFAIIALVTMNSADEKPRWSFSTLKTLIAGGLDDDKSEEKAFQEIENIRASLKQLENVASKGSDNPDKGIGADRSSQTALINRIAEQEAAMRERLDSKLRIWKTSIDGRCMGLFGDCLAKIVGGYLCLVGMGVGIVALRHGIKIEPRKV